MITNKNEATTMVIYLRLIYDAILNANSMVQHLIQIENGIIKHVDMNVKIIVHARKIIVRVLAYIFVRVISISKVLLILQ